jgi:hypothetical protein
LQLLGTHPPGAWILRVDGGRGKAGVIVADGRNLDVFETWVGAFQRGIVSALALDQVTFVLLQLRRYVVFQFPSGLAKLNLLQILSPAFIFPILFPFGL